MNVANIKLYDIANGPGVRVSLFVSGCRNHCKGCFNQETWDFSYGTPFDDAAREKVENGLKKEYIKGFTLLGGDPFEPENAKELLPFVRKLKEEFKDKSFWIYTGYMYDNVLAGKQGEDSKELLKLFDILVDGRYVEELNDMKLRFKGSTNQRVIDVPKSLKKGEVCIWNEDLEP